MEIRGLASCLSLAGFVASYVTLIKNIILRRIVFKSLKNGRCLDTFTKICSGNVISKLLRPICKAFH